MRVGSAVGVERGEALVVVVVSGEDDVGAGSGQGAPDGVEVGIVAVLAGRPAWVVPVGEQVAGRGRSEVVAEPGQLWAVGSAAADLVAVGVDHDDVPVAEVVAVVALWLRSRSGSEHAVVAGGPGGDDVVVALGGACPIEESAPGGRVAALELLGLAVFVGQITEGDDHAGMFGEQGCGGGSPAVAVRDVACREQCGGGYLWRGGLLGLGGTLGRFG